MRKGYILIEVMIAVLIAGVVAGVFTIISYQTQIQSNILKLQNTKTILEVTRSRLVNLATDPDSDSYFELLKEENTNEVPVSIGLGIDAWSKKIYYSTIDLGTVTAGNTPYANTGTSISPNSNISGRLISYGENMTLETTSADSTAQGDDVMLEIGVGEINHFKLYGSSEITTETRGYNSAIVSETEPTSPSQGSLWYKTSDDNLSIYDSGTTSWIQIN